MCDDSKTRQPDGVSPTACEILEYLTEHPKARDTLDGISEWWVLEQKIKSSFAQAREAIGELVAQELVLEYEGLDSHTHYGINRRKFERILDLLKENRGPRD